MQVSGLWPGAATVASGSCNSSPAFLLVPSANDSTSIDGAKSSAKYFLQVATAVN